MSRYRKKNGDAIHHMECRKRILQKVGEGDRRSQSLGTDLKEEGTSGAPAQSDESLELSHPQIPGLASVPRPVHQSSLVSPIDPTLSMPYPAWPSLGHIFCTLAWKVPCLACLPALSLIPSSKPGHTTVHQFSPVSPWNLTACTISNPQA